MMEDLKRLIHERLARGRQLEDENMIAIVQNGHAIFGVGKTLADAIEDAKEWVDDPACLKDLPSHSSTDGEMYWTPCTLALAQKVERHGGDIAFTEKSDGTLCTLDEEQTP